MSNGGAFRLLSNDGKQDDMIMATRYLNSRLSKIQSLRSRDPRIRDPTPSLGDIEKTHILFVNSHFKPFVAVAYEYQVVNYSKAALGSIVQFSIPLYGDFIHDMVLHIKLGAVAAKNTNAGDALIKYVDYPGERLCKNSEFSVNGNVLDNYDNDVYSFYREFSVAPNKKLAYDRLMGHQVKKEGEMVSSSGRGDNIQKTQIVTGPQVAKASQPELELWIPILFWFSRDVRVSLTSVTIPHGQRFLKLQFASADELLQHVGLAEQDDNPGSNPVPVPEINMCELYVNHIFVNPEIHTIIIKKIGFNLIRVYRLQRIIADKPQDDILLSQIKWPIESMYFGGRPTVNYSRLNSGMATDWHQYSFQTKTTHNSGSQDTNAYFWGAFANDPAQAADYTAALTRSDGRPHGLNFATILGVPGATVLTVAQVNTVLSRNGYAPLSGAFVNPLLPLNAEIRTASPDTGSRIVYKETLGAFDEIGLKAHGIELFKRFPGSFYHSYLPFQYGTDKVNAPEDSGKYVIFFNFYPGSMQPSGHINVSRAREFYFGYSSSRINTNNPVEILIIGIALNFLLISDGSAVLRYST